MGYQYRGTIHDLKRPLTPLGAEEVTAHPGIPPFDPAYCGTPYGYKQHRKHSQDPCASCREAVRAYNAEWRAKKRNGIKRIDEFTDDLCGTYAGRHRHQRYNIPLCGPCREAYRQYQSQWRAARKAAA